jgi:hypothetical protein
MHLDRIGKLAVGKFRNVADPDRKSGVVAGRTGVEETGGVEA